ncbi:MAG: hypothetical protein U5Q03_15085 [Bacteroidota bacterium]|nr:hypothetical protein [Bacteroidota bacterium]
MDFNQLKANWQNSFKQEGLTSEQILAKLKIKGQSDIILKKIMNNYRFSLIALTIIYLFIVAGLFIFIKTNIAYLIAVLITILFGVAVSYWYKSLSQIKQTITSDDDIKTALRKTILIMEKSLRFGMGNTYKYLLIPLALIFGIVIGIFIGAGEKSVIETIYNLENKSIIKIILIIVIGTGITIPFSQFMMNRMYMQHLNELKKCREELEEYI